MLTGCIGPYAELYKTYKTQKEAQEKQQKEREAREDKILNAPVTTEEHVREKEKILKSRVASNPKYQRDYAARMAEDKRISMEANQEIIELRQRQAQALYDALMIDNAGNPISRAADPVATLTERATERLNQRQDLVMAVFAAKSDVQLAANNIAKAMLTIDKQAIFSPQWVVDISGTAITPKTQCSVVVGKWYKPGFPYRASWERIMDRALTQNAIAGTYLYSRNGEFVLTENGQSQMDLVQAICFQGSKLATTDFNTIDAESGKHGMVMPVTNYRTTQKQLTILDNVNQKNAVLRLKGDALSGSACGGKLGLNVNIDDVFFKNPNQQNAPLLFIRGSLKMAMPPGPDLELPLLGAISRKDGVMNLFTPKPGSNQKYRQVALSLFRDDRGKGWQGMVEGATPNGCDDVRLISNKGRDTRDFPVMTGDDAFLLANPRMAPGLAIYTPFWLKIAESRGSIDATYYLGQWHEYQGQKSPQDYTIARQYYLTAANKYDDARAEAALGRMYAKGIGVAVDERQANTWSNKSRLTRQAAAKACASPKLQEAIKRYSTGSNNWDKKMLQAGIDVGDISLSRVTAEQVVSLKEPFICLAKGGIENPKFTMGVDDCDTIIETDRYGNQTEQDDCTGAVASKVIDVWFNKNLKEVTFNLTLELKSQGNGIYKVSHREDSGTVFETLNLN